MSDQDKPLNDGQTVAAILPTIYSSVMDFKRSLTARLWQQGFLEESSKLDDLKLTEVSGVMCLEPQLREMSNNVLKMFQLIDELMDCALQHQHFRCVTLMAYLFRKEDTGIPREAVVWRGTVLACKPPGHRLSGSKGVAALSTGATLSQTAVVSSRACHHQQRMSLAVADLYERTAGGWFRCKECGKESRLQTNIRKHLRKHTGEKPYTCSDCPAVFTYPRSLRRHQLVHKGERPYPCMQCSKRFFDQTSLRCHVRTHSDERPYECRVCGDRFRQNEGLKGHMRRHTGDKPYVCERCGLAFSVMRSLTRHIRVHTGERPYHCKLCVASFADWTTLNNHQLVHRSDADTGEVGAVERSHQCQVCGVRYMQPLSLKRHLLTHSDHGGHGAGQSWKPLRPARQPSGVRNSKDAAVALHTHYRPYACHFCSLRFKHLRGFKTHMSTKHKDDTRRPFSCDSSAREMGTGGGNTSADVHQ